MSIAYERDMQEHSFFHGVLMRYATEYLGLRVAHLVRVRPSLRGHLDDLTYQVRLQVERVFWGYRPFGGKRIFILDILIGDEMQKRKDLLTPTHQNTMINDVIDKEDDGKTKTGTTASIKNLRSLYGHFDKNLETIVETLQTFVWLDFPDVIELANVEISVTYLMEILKTRAIPENIKRSVNHQLRREIARDLPLEEALLLHYHRAAAFLKSSKERLDHEPIHMQLIRREMLVAENEPVNQLIMKCAQHMHQSGQLRPGQPLAPEQAQAYARALGVAPEQVTADAAIQYERRNLGEVRNRLASELANASTSGQPVNHKAQQWRDLNGHMERIAGALKQAGVDLTKPAPVANPEGD